MNNHQAIQAIPTDYRDSRGRLWHCDSILEARFCVFWDFIDKEIGLEWSHHDRRFLEISYYLPDFRIVGSRGLFFHEVKPCWPSENELRKCRRAHTDMQENGISLILSCGNFYRRNEPSVYLYPYDPKREIPLSVYLSGGGDLNPTFLDFEMQAVVKRAIRAADGFRFDLYQPYADERGREVA